MSFDYPSARKDENVIDDYHGVKIPDPYRWLEDPDSNETKEFVDKQNSITIPYLNSCPFKKKINSRLKSLWNFPKASVPSLFGGKYYQFRNTGLQNQRVFFVQDDLNSEGRVFLDPNTFSEDGTVALTSTVFTQNGKVLAYGLSKSGSDWMEFKFRDADSGEDYEDVLKKIKLSSIAWMHDNKTCFYGGYLHQEGKTDGSETDRNQNHKIYCHRLGTPQSEDFIAVEFDDPQYICHAEVSECGNYLVVMPSKGTEDNLVYYSHLKAEGDEINEKLDLQPIVTKYLADFDYITNDESKFLFLTNKGAPNYHLIVIDFKNPAESNWTVLVPEHYKDVLKFVKPIDNDKLVLCYICDVTHTLSLHKMETGERLLDFPIRFGSISGMSGRREHSEMFYSIVSFLHPNIIYRVDFTQAEIKPQLFQETKVGDFDPSQYDVKQVFYNSKDGTKVPMFVVHKKNLNLNGSKACLLSGYGGFSISNIPNFDLFRIGFLESFDGVYALANIRGGGEYGKKWHEGGRLGKKQNCFDDFQYAARYLIETKYTSSEKLIISGGSNGGLLVAACINQAPELFGCAICNVGVLDMLRYQKFTIGYLWQPDYGTSEDPHQFKYIFKYSPLHNIQVPSEDKQYPATLLLTGDHDDRVVPLHSLKFIAELQDKIGKLPQQKNPVLIRIDTKSGHGGGKPTSKVIDEETDIMCFIQKSLGLPYYE